MAVDNPKKSAGDKKPPMHYTPPLVMLLDGMIHANGAYKYGSFNWNETPVDCNTYYSAMLRHILLWFCGEDIDPESGLPHLAHLRASAAIILDAGYMGNLEDNRPKTMTTSARQIMDMLSNYIQAKETSKIPDDEAVYEWIEDADKYLRDEGFTQPPYYTDLKPGTSTKSPEVEKLYADKIGTAYVSNWDIEPKGAGWKVVQKSEDPFAR